MMDSKMDKMDKMNKVEKEETKKIKRSVSVTMLATADDKNQSYCLLCLQVEKAIRYAIYVEGDDEGALELVGKRRREARELFERVVQGGLSPLHLRDIALEAREEEFFAEIFS